MSNYDKFAGSPFIFVVRNHYPPIVLRAALSQGDLIPLICRVTGSMLEPSGAPLWALVNTSSCKVSSRTPDRLIHLQGRCLTMMERFHIIVNHDLVNLTIRSCRSQQTVSPMGMRRNLWSSMVFLSMVGLASPLSSETESRSTEGNPQIYLPDIFCILLCIFKGKIQLIF